MLKFSFIFSLMTLSVSGCPEINVSSTCIDITSSNYPFSYFRKKMPESALLQFRLHSLTKYLSNSISHNSSASTLPYINFPSRIKYYLINSMLMITKSTMPSVHSIYISTSILVCRNATSTSQNSLIHPPSSY